MERINTKYGQINVEATGQSTKGEHIYFNTDHVPDLVIRGCKYRVSGHLYRHTDGLFHFGPEFTEQKTFDGVEQRRASDWERFRDGLYMSKLDPNASFIWHDADKVSSAAKKTATDEIEQAINQWAKDYPWILEHGETERIKKEIELTLSQIQQAQDELVALQVKREELTKQLDYLNGRLAARTQEV